MSSQTGSNIEIPAKRHSPPFVFEGCPARPNLIALRYASSRLRARINLVFSQTRQPWRLRVFALKLGGLATDPSSETRGLQPERDGRVLTLRCSARLAGTLQMLNTNPPQTGSPEGQQNSENEKRDCDVGRLWRTQRGNRGSDNPKTHDCRP